MKIKINHKAFSLVEVMIVVAILSLLAVIGIPQYSKMKIKVRETEAKVGLANLYQSMNSFQSEFGFYHSSLPLIGFSMQGKIYFNIGFGRQTNVDPNDFGYTAPINVAAINTKALCTGFGTGTDSSCELMVDPPNLSFIATAYDQTFVAIAATNLTTVTEYIVPTPGSTLMLLASQVLQSVPALAVDVTEDECGDCDSGDFLLARRCANSDVVPDRLVRRGQLVGPSIRVFSITAKNKQIKQR